MPGNAKPNTFTSPWIHAICEIDNHFIPVNSPSAYAHANTIVIDSEAAQVHN